MEKLVLTCVGDVNVELSEQGQNSATAEGPSLETASLSAIKGKKEGSSVIA